MSGGRSLHETGVFLEPLRRVLRGGLARLPWWLSEFLLFGLKMAWSCVFAGAMLGFILLSHFVWQPGWPVHRYDALLIAALALQAALLALKMEKWEEARVILVYHIIGTAMEIFKVSMGSWAYPEPGLFKLFGVPLFSGFMYASVGSFMIRAMRIFDMRFSHYPPLWLTLALDMAIYLNFYLHHYFADIRVVLFAATVLLFFRVNISFTTDRTTLSMPLVLAAALSALFLWIAENIGTLTGTWVYPGQSAWHPVSFSKFGSWYLLLYVSFTLVTLVVRPEPPDGMAEATGLAARRPNDAEA